MRIGLIDYLNPAPFYWDLEQRLSDGAEFVRDVPSKVNQALLAGDLQASIVSAHFAAEHAEELLILPGVSVAVRGEVRSVLLFSWESNLSDLSGKRVAITTSSASSVNLLKILLSEHCAEAPTFHRAEPDLDTMLEDADAALIIGDGALREYVARRPVRRADGSEAQPVIFDLPAEWLAITGKPFVFALWAVRRDAAEAVRRLDFEAQLKASLAGGTANLETIASRAATRLDLPPETCLSYLKLLEYGLSGELVEGLEEFKRRAFPPDHRRSFQYL